MKRSPRKRSREETQAETRRQLLDAAARQFARLGYRGVSLDAVAATAGYSKGAVYANFESKEDLLLQLLAEHMETKMQTLERVLQPGALDGAGLENLDQTLSLLNEGADWPLLAIELQLVARRERSFGAKADELFERHRVRLGELVARLFAAAGRKPAIPPLEIARATSALVEGMACQAGLKGQSDAVAGRLISQWMRLLVATGEKLR